MMVDYRTSIKVAFTKPHIPDIMLMAMPEYIRVTHHCIMDLPPKQRESRVVWHFGDEAERNDLFGISNKDPSILTGVYRKIGRRHRG